MCGKGLVFITARQIDENFAMIGIQRETNDYSIAMGIEQNLRDAKVGVCVKSLDEACDEDDKIALDRARILIVVATKQSYLDAAQRIISDFEAVGKKDMKRIIYLSVDGAGDMEEQDFPLTAGSSRIISESVTISKMNTVDSFVGRIRAYLDSYETDKQASVVIDILKKSCSSTNVVIGDITTERSWLENELNVWLEKSGKRHHVFWLCGDHGAGKTTFMGDYYSRLTGVGGKSIYYCHYSNLETQSIERIIRAIAHAMSISIAGYAKAVYGVVTDERFQNMAAEELILELLVNPFTENPNLLPKTGNVVFIIDGLDELRTSKVDVLTPFLDLLCEYASVFPQFMRLIITSPADHAIENAMCKLSARTLNLSKQKYQTEIKNDAERFLKAELDALGVTYSDDQIQQILKKAEWNFDYLHYFVEQIDEGDDIELPETENMPEGVAAIYQSDFDNRFSTSYYNEKVRPVLQILAAVYEPFSVVDLSGILGMNMNEIQIILKGQLRQFLNISTEGSSQEETTSICRVSMSEWLQQKNHSYCLDAGKGADAILVWMKKEEYKNYFKNPYLKKYGLLHALERGRDEIIEELIEKAGKDDFERLKEGLAILFMADFRNQIVPARELVRIYRSMPANVIRVRDILVYTYRYVLKHRGNGASGLEDISQLLIEKNEEVRARLLKGEGIENYEEAKKYFHVVIEKAQNIIKINEGNEWWNRRMLGVAYNRLANLENRHGQIEEAKKWYGKGKGCFDEAVQIMKADSVLCEEFQGDYAILRRDQAIINERLGDLSFEQRNFREAERYYQAYHEECLWAEKEESTLNSRWDLSISYLRIGDVKRYLGFYKDARENYRRALELRRDIFLHMRSDCAGLIANGNQGFYLPFECRNDAENVPETVEVDAVLKESRDMEPIRDIAICYARLGDLALFVGETAVAKQYYDIFYRLCARNHAEIKTASTERDLEFSEERRRKICDRVSPWEGGVNQE